MRPAKTPEGRWVLTKRRYPLKNADVVVTYFKVPFIQYVSSAGAPFPNVLVAMK
jgi:hypothetical protein